MKTTCPQCGKIMDVSSEELALRDGRVVCPQCLNDYQAVDPATLPKVVVPVEQHQEPTSRTPHYCPHCGEDIGRVIHFCPYCGKSLIVDSESIDDEADAQPAERQQASSRRTSHHGHSKHAHRHEHNAGNATPAFDWKPMIPSYRMVQQRQHEPANIGFQAFAIAIIIALLVLLAFIIYHAIQLT